jgi:hypothetical protein
MNQNDAKPFTELEQRLCFETQLADRSPKMVDLPAGEADRKIMNAQRRLCEFLDLDLLLLGQLSEG